MKDTARNRASRHNDRVERVGYTRLYATVSGALLVLLGLAGLVENAEFEEPELWSDLLGTYAVNGWASLLHICLGLAALLLAQRASRLWAVIASSVFIGLGAWGVLAADGTLLLGVLPATRAVNLLNLLLGALALLALVASRWDRIRKVLTEREQRARERRTSRKRRRERELRRRRLGPGAPRRGRADGKRGGGSEAGS
jgi:hypothetical protein